MITDKPDFFPFQANPPKVQVSERRTLESRIINLLRNPLKLMDDGFEDELAGANLSDSEEQYLRELSPAYKIAKAYHSFIGAAKTTGRKLAEFSYHLLPC